MKLKFSLFHLFNVVCAVSFFVCSSQAVQLQADNCPTPHNGCTASCGTSCTYWTCEDSTTSPVSSSMLPFRYDIMNGVCESRRQSVSITSLPTQATVAQGQSPSLQALPLNVTVGAYICASHEQDGGCCNGDQFWSISGWSSCSPGCDSSCTEYASVTCNAPNGRCCPGSQPNWTRENRGPSCPPPPPPPPPPVRCNYWCWYNASFALTGGPEGGGCSVGQVDNCGAPGSDTASGQTEVVGNGGWVAMSAAWAGVGRVYSQCKISNQADKSCP